MTDDAPPPEDLDALVARVDPDRWLSSRLIADPEARADAIAIYAYDHELARAPRVASNPLLGEIRLTWWREVLDLSLIHISDPRDGLLSRMPSSA